MKIRTLGAGFISDHLPYPRIEDRLHEITARAVEKMLDYYTPDVLINCIGKTGRPNVDWCESNKEITANINVALPIILAEACTKRNIRLIQIGSGCIYFGESPHLLYTQGDGSPMPDVNNNISKTFSFQPFSLVMPTVKTDEGWRETDFANPKSFYSKSKYACDLMLGQMPTVTVLRIRMPISSQDNPRNLINKLKGYRKVIGIPNSMTFMDDLTRCVDWVIKGDHTGIFHVVNPQPITAVRIMTEYQKYVPEHSFEIISEAQLDQMTIAKRSNCILSTEKLQATGFQMSNSEESLIECMANYVKNMRSVNVK